MDYYELLGVNRDASQEAIKRAFHSHVRVLHPDVNQDDIHASQKTRRLIEAYRTLSDPLARSRYDLFTGPVVSDTPTIVPAGQTEDYYQPFIHVNRGWLLLALITVIIGLALYATHQDDRMVFRPFLVNGELPSAVHIQNHPLLIEPNPTEYMEWYHTQQYLVSCSDPWATEQIVRTYKRAAARARSQGDVVRADFYNSAVKNVSRLYL